MVKKQLDFEACDRGNLIIPKLKSNESVYCIHVVLLRKTNRVNYNYCAIIKYIRHFDDVALAISKRLKILEIVFIVLA